MNHNISFSNTINRRHQCSFFTIKEWLKTTEFPIADVIINQVKKHQLKETYMHAATNKSTTLTSTHHRNFLNHSKHKCGKQCKPCTTNQNISVSKWLWITSTVLTALNHTKKQISTNWDTTKMMWNLMV